MIFSKALLAKGLGSLALLSTSCVSAYGGHKIIKNEPTKFDQGLLDYLEDSGKIKFSIKKNDTEDMTTFPDFTNDTSEIKISIKLTATTSSTGTEGTLIQKTNGNDGDKGKTETLKKLNGGNDWTWTCIIKFIRVGENNNATELKDKDKVFKNSTTGFLNKLKEENNKDEKEKFIKNCAEARGGFKNLKIGLSSSLSDNKIESIKEFKLVKGDSIGKSGEDANKLFPVNEEEFNDLFKINN